MRTLKTCLLFVALTVSARAGFIYVPFSGTNHHTGFEAWPGFCGGGYDSNCLVWDWPGWQGWRAFDTNFTLAEGRFAALENVTASLPDAATNGIVNSPKIIANQTNVVTFTGYTQGIGSSWIGTTNILPWVVTNPAGVTYDMPAGTAQLMWSRDATNWASGGKTLTTTGAVHFAFTTSIGWPFNPPATNSSSVP